MNSKALSELESKIAQLKTIADSEVEDKGGLKSVTSAIENEFRKLEVALIPLLSDTAPVLAGLKDRELRWQDTSVSQVSFFNNLLILLGTGFLGFAFNASEISKYQAGNAQWQPTCIFLALLLMTLSVLLGLLCGFNRILDFRYTHRINRYRRKLYQATQINKKPNSGEKVCSPLFYWFWKASFYEIAENEYNSDSTGVSKKIDKLSMLIKRFGRTTRNLLKFEWLLFLFSIIAYALSFIG